LDRDGISYLSYSPPSLWQAPYQVHRASFDPVESPPDFMYHAGEELLAPIIGSIQYHFYWSAGGTPLHYDPATTLLTPGLIARVNPQLPHHGWLPQGYESQAQAWMVFGNDIPTAISRDRRFQQSGGKLRPRRVTAQQLDQEGYYGLIAWGLSDAIRLRRHAADLQLSELADVADIDRSYLLRIERGEANASLATLLRLAEALHIDVEGQIEQSTWQFAAGALWTDGPALKPRGVICGDAAFARDHRLHTSSLMVNSGVVPLPSLEAHYSSWIVMDGSATATITTVDGATVETATEELSTHAVLHLRGGAQVQLESRAQARLLGIHYLHECPYSPQAKRSADV